MPARLESIDPGKGSTTHHLSRAGRATIGAFVMVCLLSATAAASPWGSKEVALQVAPPGFYARGDANCDALHRATDVSAAVRGYAGASICANDDCDRDGRLTAADVECAATCLFGRCATLPTAPRITAVEPASAAAITPLSVIRVLGEHLGSGQRLAQASLGEHAADVIEMVSPQEWLVLVPELAPGSYELTVADGDIDSSPFRLQVAARSPLGAPDTFDGSLGLLDLALERYSLLALAEVYGESAVAVRAAIDRFRTNLAGWRADLLADPAYTPSVRAELDAIIDGSGVSEMLRDLLSRIDQVAAVRSGGTATAELTVIARIVGQTTRVMATVVIRAAPELGLPVLATIAAGVGIVAAIAVAVADTPVITKVIPDFPRPGAIVEIEGTGFGNVPPLPSLVVKAGGGELVVSADEMSGGLLRYHFPVGVGLCGSVELSLVRLSKRSNSVPARIQPILEELLSTTALPADELVVRALGAVDCHPILEFTGPVRDVSFPDPVAANFLTGHVPERLPPGTYGVRIGSGPVLSLEQLNLRIESPITSLSVRCGPFVFLPPDEPTRTLCQTFPRPEGTVFPKATSFSWTSSNPDVGAIEDRDDSATFVDARRFGTTTISAEAFVPGPDGQQRRLARSEPGFVIAVRDGRVPQVGLTTTLASTIPAAATIEVRAAAEDNGELDLIGVAASGDAVLIADQSVPCLPQGSCSATFRFDVKAEGQFQQRQVTLIARARDSAGNTATSAPLTFFIGAPPTPTSTPTATATLTRTPTMAATATPSATATGPTATVAPLRAYVTNPRSDTVTVVNLANLSTMGTITVGDDPRDVALSPNGATAYVANRQSRTVSVIDTATRAVISTEPVPLYPVGVSVSPDGGSVYVTGDIGSAADAVIAVIDAATRHVRDRVEPSVFGGDNVRTRDAAFTPNGLRVYVTVLTHDEVVVLSTATNAIVKHIPVGDIPSRIAVTPQGDRAYVFNVNSRDVSIIDTTDNTVTGTITGFGNFVDLDLGGDLGIRPDGRFVVVSPGAQASQIYLVDTATSLVTPVNASGNRGLAFTPDGSRVHLIGSQGTVRVRDGSTLATRGSYDAGDDGWGIAIGAVPQ